MQKSAAVVLIILSLIGFFLVAASIDSGIDEKYYRMMTGVSLLISGTSGLVVLCLSYKRLWLTEVISPLVLILPTLILTVPRVIDIDEGSLEAD